MVTLPKQRVQEVHFKCRFCAFHHFNTRNKGTVYIPGQIFGKDDPFESVTDLLEYTFCKASLWQKSPKRYSGTVKMRSLESSI